MKSLAVEVSTGRIFCLLKKQESGRGARMRLSGSLGETAPDLNLSCNNTSGCAITMSKTRLLFHARIAAVARR
jgi:hypothetical protein